MTTILVRALDSPENVAYDRIFRYGTNCSLKGMIDDNDFWSAEFEVHVPVEIKDEKRNKLRVFPIRVENLGKIKISKQDLKVVEAPSLLTVEKIIHDHRVNLRRAVERDLLKVAPIEFGKIDAAKNALSPIFTTLTNILEEKFPSEESILRSGYWSQIHLLEELGYVKREESRVVASDKLVDLRESTDSDATAISKVLGLVLAEKLDFLVEELRITQFLPFVRLGTTFYSEAVQFGELISVSEDSLRQSYLEYYRTASEKRLLRYAPIINELVEVGILRYDDEFISGEQAIFQQLAHDLAGQFPRPGEPYEPV
jgi:hypothetical protein